MAKMEEKRRRKQRLLEKEHRAREEEVGIVFVLSLFPPPFLHLCWMSFVGRAFFILCVGFSIACENGVVTIPSWVLSGGVCGFRAVVCPILFSFGACTCAVFECRLVKRRRRRPASWCSALRLRRSRRKCD